MVEACDGGTLNGISGDTDERWNMSAVTIASPSKVWPSIIQSLLWRRCQYPSLGVWKDRKISKSNYLIFGQAVNQEGTWVLPRPRALRLTNRLLLICVSQSEHTIPKIFCKHCLRKQKVQKLTKYSFRSLYITFVFLESYLITKVLKVLGKFSILSSSE